MRGVVLSHYIPGLAHRRSWTRVALLLVHRMKETAVAEDKSCQAIGTPGEGGQEYHIEGATIFSITINRLFVSWV